jgi:parallel beta-helix repeat protein
LFLSVFVGSLATFLVSITPALSQPPASGDWVVTGPETVENETITLDANLVVSATGSLTLTNVTLAMDCSNDGEYGITVAPGGSLLIADSVITAATGNGFDFAVHGASFEMANSELHGAGWGPEQELGSSNAIDSGQRGLVIGTDEAILEGNTLSHNHVGAILTGAGITLTNNAIISNTIHGIYVQGGTNNWILSNTIRHGGNASSPIRMHTACDNHVVSNTIQSSIHRGIIETFESQGNLFEHNDISGMGIGVLMMFVSNENVVRENTIAVDEAGVMAWGWGNDILSNTISSQEGLFPIGTGIYMVYAYNSEVRGNALTGVSEEHGIWLRNASGNVIAGNTASASLTGIPRASVGLLLNNHSHHNVAYGNTFTGFDRGLGLFYNSDANVIAGNAFSSTAREGAIVDDASGNVVYQNNFVDVELPPFDDGENAWDDGSHGNYWSDYSGAGAYPIPPNGSDRFPLREPVEIGSHSLSAPTPIAAPSLTPLFSRAITENTEIADQALNLGWIDVQSGASLTLTNVTLTTGGGDTASSIEVATGGALFIYDSTITHLENGVGFQMNMRDGSHFVMEDSELTGCGHEWWYGGVHFYGDDFLLEHNAITDTILTIFDSHGGRVISNTIARSYQAVDLENSSAEFVNNTFLGSIRPAINGAGSDNIVEGNTVVDVWGNGLYLWDCPDCRLAANTISGIPPSYAGIRMAGTGGLLTGNTITDAHVGLWLDQALTATHNTVTDCHTGIAAHGEGGHVEGNDLSGCTKGMWLKGDNYTIVSNTFSSNQTGLTLTLTCDQNLIYENVFSSNDTQAYDGSALIFENYWDNGSRGNQWSDYAGLDANGDGIGETPYSIPPHEGRQDRYPLVETRRVFLPLVLRAR